MDVASIYLNEDDIKSEMNINLEDFGGKEKNDKISVSIGDLYKIMEEAIDKEEYEIAASIRDRIKEVEKERLKKKNKKNKSKKQK
jgi:protein-arginine kinase activator protein McsA